MNGKASEYVIGGAPGVTVASMNLFGYPIADVASLAALIWTVVSMGLMIYDRAQKRKDKKNGG